MIIKNVYWFMHWGSSFSVLDSMAWVKAREIIWDAMTTNASINFFKPILVEEFESFSKEIIVISESSSSVTMNWYIKKDWITYVSATFTFVKMKKS